MKTISLANMGNYVPKIIVGCMRMKELDGKEKCVHQPIEVNQLQLGIMNASVVANGMNVNTPAEQALNRDGDVLDYCRLHGITIQAWSPFQSAHGVFLKNEKYPELNRKIMEIAENVSSLTLKKGQKKKVTAVMTPLDATDTITWISSNPKIVKVNSKGIIAAKKQGMAVVMAKTESGASKNKSDSKGGLVCRAQI
ncbi:MAG: Ig-like domain-containing protein [Eubacterium sp.]|nr:Ig-like domain-containing protein [Eubacterium sp.]